MIHRGQKVLDATLDQIRARFDPRRLFVQPANGDGEALLRAVDGVADVESNDEGFDLRLGDGADPSEAIRRITQAIPVRRIELKQVSLEDVFIDLVQASGDQTIKREHLRMNTKDAIPTAAQEPVNA
jgi:ABC-type uncharacterized transport system ATPase subunit